MMKKRKWIIGLMATAMVFGAARAELVLVENKKSLAPIILAADATKDTRRAAVELANYFEKIGGTKPEVVTGWPDPVPAQAIWVGVQPGLDTFFPEIPLTFQHPEEILLAANANHLVIAGRDRLVSEQQVEFGTANAVYTFLQKKLEVRWLWPGPLGEDVIARKTIALKPFEYRYHPQFRMRTFRGITGRIHRWPIAPELADWARFQRLGFASLRINPYTSFTQWGERFGDTHPEYLALQPDGTRPGSIRAKVCMSNPDVWKQWLDDVTNRLQINPTDNVFGGAPADNHNRGICVCDECRAWDVKDGPIWGRYFWRGLSQEYVAMSDRYATFINHLADQLKERYPDRDLYVYDMAYGPNMPAPLQTTMADNTLIGYVGYFPFGNTETRERQKTEFKAWAQNAPHLMYRPNYWYFGGGVWGIPEVALTHTIEDYRFLAEHNCIGLDIDTFFDHWGTQGPQYYLLAKLAWNPMQDGQALLADYYNRGFGPAAAEIEQYWQLMEEAREALISHPKHNQGARFKNDIINIIRDIFNDDRLSQAEHILDRAAAAAKTGSKIHEERVAFFRTGLDIVRKMLASAAYMDRIRETKGTDAEAVASTLTLWKDIEAMTERFPHVINYKRLRFIIEKSVYMGNVQEHFGPPSEAWLEAVTNTSASAAMPGSTPAIVELPKSDPSQSSPIELTDWKLVLHDRFDREALGANWTVTEGNASIRNGELFSPGMTLITARDFPGFHRLEYEAVAVTNSKPFSLFEGAARQSEVTVSDLSGLIQAGTNDPPISTGYFFQLGSRENTQNLLLREGKIAWRDEKPELKIVPGQLHRIIVENDEGHIRFIVDGNVVFEGREPSSLVGEGRARAGLYLGSAASIKEIKLYVKELDDGLI